MNYIVFLLTAAVMIALRFTRLKVLGWVFVWWAAIYVVLSYGIDPPLPTSVVFMFMGIMAIVLLTYLSANSDDLEQAKQTVVRFVTDKKYVLRLTALLVAIPILAMAKVYFDANKPVQAPGSGRTIHPPPPPEIQFKGKTINLSTADNPYRHFETSNPDSFRIHVENGRRVYFQNCVYCHGDDMKGKGIFAHGFDPVPANFADPTTIALLQESYLFWRIAKGGPDLPEEATPWLSAMPAWEKFLTEEEIWDVILFLYEYTNQVPREREEVH
jgi:mono/diheme cytochrome c family protein